jgi:hypothetical protein
LWFVPLLEKDFRILTKFNDTFGETDKVLTATTKIHLLCQGSRSASVYAEFFCQLAYDVNYDDNALISALQWELRDDVKE